MPLNPLATPLCLLVPAEEHGHGHDDVGEGVDALLSLATLAHASPDLGEQAGGAAPGAGAAQADVDTSHPAMPASTGRRRQGRVPAGKAVLAGIGAGSAPPSAGTRRSSLTSRGMALDDEDEQHAAYRPPSGRAPQSPPPGTGLARPWLLLHTMSCEVLSGL